MLRRRWAGPFQPRNQTLTNGLPRVVKGQSQNGLPECIGSSMSKSEKFIALAVSAVLLSVVSLCPLGARAEEPGRSKTTGYPAVEDVPPRPEKPAMTADQLSKLKKDLTATRDRQTAAGKARGGAARVEPAKP